MSAEKLDRSQVIEWANACRLWIAIADSVCKQEDIDKYARFASIAFSAGRESMKSDSGHCAAAASAAPTVQPQMQDVYPSARTGSAPTAPTWTPVSDLLPEIRWRNGDEDDAYSDVVLVAVEFDGPGDWRIKCGWVNEFGVWTVWGGSWQPSHWMQLPDPPHRAVEALPATDHRIDKAVLGWMPRSKT